MRGFSRPIWCHSSVAGRRIGLLGGAFNPAHQGHLRISFLALSHLALDEIWWVVSPCHPVKPEAGMAAFETRLAGARHLARHPQLRVKDWEYIWGSRFTADTLALFRTYYPRTRFVWIMGADNLRQISDWRGWKDIFSTFPIAVFARPSYSLPALFGQAALRYRRWRVPVRQARFLALKQPPAWVFLHNWLHPVSASSIRLAGNARPVVDEILKTRQDKQNR